MKYLIYTRVSPKGSDWVGSETTVVDQEAQCRAYVLATDPGGQVIEAITDEFASGGSSKRPGWQKIVSDLKRGTAAWDVLVVRHLDRFSRSLSDAVHALELIHSSGKCLIATAQGLNSSTPSGRGVINILLSIAQMEREFSGERTKLKMISIARNGLWPVGKPPYGYMRGKKHDNKLYVHPERAEHVRSMFRRYQEGVKALELSRDYGIPRSTVYTILNNRVYLGVVPYDGKEYQGQHEALISPAEFKRVQDLRPGRGHAPRPRSQKYPYILSGLIKCECGCCMTPSSSHGRGGRRYHYYRCTDLLRCKGRVRATDVEEDVLYTLGKIRLTPDDVEGVVREIRSIVSEGTKASDSLEDMRSQLFDAEQRRDNIMEMFASGLIRADNAPRINQKLAQVCDQCNDLRAQVKAQEGLLVASDPVVEDMTRFVRSMNTLGDALKVAARCPDEQRQIITTWVRDIRRTGEGWSVVLNLPGAPNVLEWLRILDVDAPLLQIAAGPISVYVRAA